MDFQRGESWIGNAISYGPHRDGQRPGVKEPEAAEILDDLRLMQPHWNLLRVYGASGFAENMLQLIRDEELDIKVMLGAWIARDAPEANQAEVEAAIRLANEFPEIVLAVSVGNETQVEWSAHRSPLEDLIGYLRQVRAGVKQPVTTADDFNFWNKPASQAVAAEIDFITMHAHPMWNGILLDDALPWLQARLKEIQTHHPERLVLIGETGWATSVHDEGEQARLIKGKPGESEQQEFYDAARDWARNTGQPLFFFEAFDEKWKGGEHPSEVEKHWGLFRADRSPKSAIAGGVRR